MRLTDVFVVVCVSLVLTGRLSVALEDVFLENWMGRLAPLIDNVTLLDLSVPGTHDSMTYDLSTTVADDANDINPFLAAVLHDFHDIAVPQYIRNQSTTQGSSVLQQLNGGIRFIDFRITYTASPDGGSLSKHDWYCLHFLETQQPALSYLKLVRDWLVAHPSEIIVIWLSRHGGTCSSQYPNVSAETKQAFWKQIEELFDGLLFDTTQSSTNETAVGVLKQRNHRALFYVSDIDKDFTNNSTKRMDGCQIDNELPSRLQNVPNMYNQLEGIFKSAHERKRDKRLNQFYLMSLSGSVPNSQMEYAALLDFEPFLHEDISTKCAVDFQVYGMQHWCPRWLQAASQLTNYYVAPMLERVVQPEYVEKWDLPNSIYIDGVDEDGSIRTGTRLFGRMAPGLAPNRPHATAKYAYSATVIASNLNRLCYTLHHTPPEICITAAAQLNQLRGQFPLLLWDDHDYGRRTDWPVRCGNKWVNATSCSA